MKQLIGHDVGTYAFNAAAKTVTFAGVTLTLEQILLVVDSTQGIIIFSTGSNTLGGSYAGGVLTLDFDTTGFSNADSLQIYVDVPVDLALESGGNLAAIKADTDKIPSQGQALSSASMPVVLPAAQITTLTPPAAITNFANETGGNLAAIKADTDKIPSQGQALAAASMPVVLPAAQITTLTPPAALTNFANETGGNLAGAKTDLDTIAGAVSASKITVSPNGVRANIGTATVQSTSASAVTLIAAISSTHTDILQLILTNESSTATVVSISDGASTYKFAIAASGGGSFTFNSPLPATSTDTAWTVSNSAAVNVDCVVTYVKN